MTHTEYMRVWRRNNPLKNAEASMRWRKKHPEESKVASRKGFKKWLLNHPEIAAIKRAIWRNQSRFGGLRYEVIHRDKYKCVKCFSSINLTVDHIDRNKENNVLKNLQTLCNICHGKKDH